MTPRFEPMVLCYHGISDTWDHPLAVRLRSFERQVALVRRRFRPAGAADVVAGRGRLFHVTFDDALASIGPAIDHLLRLRVPVTIFACPAFAADGGRIFDVPELAIDASTTPEELRTIGWEGLRELAERGVEVGAHTVSHPHLTRLSDVEIEAELRESRASIEAELGTACRFLAYPYGDEDGRVQAIAAQTGYTAAFGLPGRRSGWSPFGVPRIGIYRKDTLVRTWAKASPAVQRVRERIGG